MSHRTIRTVAALLGVTLAATSQAAVTNITGFGVGAGLNAGLAAGSSTTFNNLFGIAGADLAVANGAFGNNDWGLYSASSFPFGTTIEFAWGGSSGCDPMRVAAGTFIDGSSTFNWLNAEGPTSTNAQFKNTFASSVAPSFGPDTFMAFRVDDGGTWRYGYFEVTWDGTNFEIISGAYESTSGTGIMTPSNSGAVPMPGAAALAACGLLAAGRRRRR